MVALDNQEFKSSFDREARRLRLNMLRLGGLATSGAGWQEQLLSRMRSLEPGCTWQDVFPGMILPDPPPEMHDRIVAVDADPDIYWQRAELHEALWREIKRVLPAELARGGHPNPGDGLSFPGTVEHTLSVLRSLPDGAGAEAARAALTKVPEES
jgi:hypothetical protein